jgi:hypothetical protein
MADEYRAVSNLATISVLSANDKLIVCLSNGAVRTANTRSAFSNTSSPTVIGNLQFANNATPLSSAVSCSLGQIWADDQYIYVATADNFIKRVALSAF